MGHGHRWTASSLSDPGIKNSDPHPPLSPPRQGLPQMTDLFLERDARISDCGRYRYLLRRTWDHSKPRALFVMLNPSTADAEIDDATIRSCIRLSRERGYGSFEVVNLYAWRATDPEELPTPPSMALGSENPHILNDAIARADTVICAWGAHP